MRKHITANQSIKVMENNIAEEVATLEIWGDLELSYEELEYMQERIKNYLERSFSDIEAFSRAYPHVITTYMVFLIRYKYDVNFWGLLAENLGTSIPQPSQAALGQCTKKMFKKYNMDYSDTKYEPRVHLAPIMYEAGLPPESCIDDLFYLFSYDVHRVFDPELVVDELIDMRSFAIRKPLLRFLERFRKDKAVEFILSVRDAMTSLGADSGSSSRYHENYINWKKTAQNKNVIINRKKQEYQTKPYLFFENGKKGLSIVLPRIILSNEWTMEVEWEIIFDGGKKKSVHCNVIGNDGVRYVDTLTVPVPPSKEYVVALEDFEGLDDTNIKPWEIEGVSNEELLMFNSNGRRVGAFYIPSPYGVIIVRDTFVIKDTKHVELSDQYYPTSISGYRILSITPTGSDASFTYEADNSIHTITSRPQINMSLSGKKVFSLEVFDNSPNIFTDIPELNITVDGVMVTNDLELRIGTGIYPIKLKGNLENTFNLKKLLKNNIKGYGSYSVRLYQYGRFLKQIEFSYIPKLKSTYSPLLKWPDDNNRKRLIQYKFQKLAEWEMEFTNCTVFYEEEKYIVEAPPNAGVIHMTLKPVSDETGFECEIDLPVRPFEIELVDTVNDLRENLTNHRYRTGVDELITSDKWLLLQCYGEFGNSTYRIQLRTVNGVEQDSRIQLMQNQSGNLNIACFYDTIQKCPLPAEIVLVQEENTENAVVLISISEKSNLSVNPNYRCVNDKAYISLSVNDDEKDIEVQRFGRNHETIKLKYSDSTLGNTGKTRGYRCPNTLKEGLYVVNAIKKDTIFEFEEEEETVDLSVGRNVMSVSCRAKGETTITSIKQWLDLFVKDVFYCANDLDLSTRKSFVMFEKKQVFNGFQRTQFDDTDIEKLTALAYGITSRISNKNKQIIKECMNYIAIQLLERGDRIRIIEMLVDSKCSQEVFDICMKEYSLMLFFGDKRGLQTLASKVEPYSVELALLLSMSTDGSIRECFWKEKYRNIIGKEAIIKMLDVPSERKEEKIKEERIKFLQEKPGNGVRIAFDDEISGNKEAMDGMISYDRKGNAVFDIRKKPDYGIYFAQIKYVDQYVNWYKNNHGRDNTMNEEKKQRMIALVKEEYQNIQNGIEKLRSDKEMWTINKQYRDTLRSRYYEETGSISLNINSIPRYFYLQGLAAFLARLPIDRKDLDELRETGIRFMSEALTIAPRLSRRDIIMATTFIYLKRKEAKLCR